MEEKRISKIPSYVVLGSGGHTAEMCEIIKGLYNALHTSPNCFFVVASSDKTSRRQLEDSLGLKTKPKYVEIPRSREVYQNYFTSVFTTLLAILVCFYILYRDKPKLILCNGPGTCVPVCVVAALYRFVHIMDPATKIVFIESFCRVKSLSLSGKILLHIADVFVVQWEQLLQERKNMKYFGRLL